MSEHRVCPQTNSDQLDGFGKPLNEHTPLFNSTLGTVRCSCGLWATFRTTPGRCQKDFEAHVSKETITPTDTPTRLRAQLKPLFITYRVKGRLPC